MSVQLPESRLAVIGDQFEQPYMTSIKQFLVERKEQGETVYPPSSLIFNAFNLTPFDELKVVIL